MPKKPELAAEAQALSKIAGQASSIDNMSTSDKNGLVTRLKNFESNIRAYNRENHTTPFHITTDQRVAINTICNQLARDRGLPTSEITRTQDRLSRHEAPRRHEAPSTAHVRSGLDALNARAGARPSMFTEGSNQISAAEMTSRLDALSARLDAPSAGSGGRPSMFRDDPLPDSAGSAADRLARLNRRNDIGSSFDDTHRRVDTAPIAQRGGGGGGGGSSTSAESNPYEVGMSYLPDGRKRLKKGQLRKKIDIKKSIDAIASLESKKAEPQPDTPNDGKMRVNQKHSRAKKLEAFAKPFEELYRKIETNEQGLIVRRAPRDDSTPSPRSGS